jgi:hypothetical protein
MPEDPAAVIAAHREETRYGTSECTSCGIGGGNVGVAWPCESYRLAVELAAALNAMRRASEAPTDEEASRIIDAALVALQGH